MKTVIARSVCSGFGLTRCCIFLTFILLNGCSTKFTVPAETSNQWESILSHVNTSACYAFIDKYQGNPPGLAFALEKEAESFQLFAEEILAERSNSIALSKRAVEASQQRSPLSPLLMEQLSQAMSRVLANRKKIQETISRHNCWLLPDGEPGEVKDRSGIDPGDQIKGLMISLAGSLLFYDSYAAVVAIITENDRLRRFLNESNLGYDIADDQLDALTKSYLAYDDRILINAEIFYYGEHKNELQVAQDVDDPFAYISLLIEQSRSHEVLKHFSTADWLQERIDSRSVRVGDNFEELRKASTNSLSKLFGNAVGMIEKRKGKLYNDPVVEQIVADHLQAGDILIEKTPFRLTDRFIPGFWGHAAVWIGTESELKAIGIWEHSLVQSYQAEIRAGHGVVEALRSGVEISKLDSFLNIDDLAIIRKPVITPSEQVDVILRALRQMGKAYDFNYDVETSDKIICSELVYVAYPEINWPTDKMLGRYTVSPDHVAQQVSSNGPLKVVLLYRDGEQVNENIEATLLSLQVSEQ